nr:hypothetical protein [Tanacetum cinerariifolium]
MFLRVSKKPLVHGNCGTRYCSSCHSYVPRKIHVSCKIELATMASLYCNRLYQACPSVNILLTYLESASETDMKGTAAATVPMNSKHNFLAMILNHCCDPCGPMVFIDAAVSRHDRSLTMKAGLEDGGRSVDCVDLWIIGRGVVAESGYY